MKNSAFTLVELAIVIVIIGLLVGGVLQGAELIKQAENNKLISSIEGYKSATIIFKDKYSKYPGDLNRATQYWGTAASCPGGPGGTGTQTCDGNGDNNISLWEDGSQHNEFFRYWQHLANAGLIKGSYLGYTSSGTLHNSTNAPQGPHKGSFFSILNTNVTAGGNLQAGAGGFTGLAGHFYVYGQYNTSGHPWSPFTDPANAFSIDLKADDGKPGSGKWTALTSASPYTPNCVIGTNAATATYNISLSSNECSFVIFPGY